MLNTLKLDSIDELIDQAVQSAVKATVGKFFNDSSSEEHEVLKDLRQKLSLAPTESALNFLGQGYFGCITHPTFDCSDNRIEDAALD
jgi:glycine cleavage system pyridoxal-binding protein P